MDGGVIDAWLKPVEKVKITNSKVNEKNCKLKALVW
jgi:hypothetical protein